MRWEAASLHVRDEDTSTAPTLLFYVIVGSSCWLFSFFFLLGNCFAVGRVVIVSRAAQK